MLRYYYILILFILSSNILKTMEDTSNLSQKAEYINLQTAVGIIRDFKYNPDGSKIAIIGQHCPFAEIWDTNTNKIVCSLNDTAPITSINFHPNLDIIITGNSNYRLKSWSFYGECITNNDTTHSLKNDQSFINSPIITYASYLDSYNVAYVSSHKNNSIFKIFSHPNNFDKLPFMFEYDLGSDEKVESVASYDDNYFFLRLKNSITERQICNVFRKNEDNSIYELAANYPIYDYCSVTNNCLILIDKKQLVSCPFAPAQTEQKCFSVYNCNSNIKSATFNRVGSEILVITEDGLMIVLEKKNQNDNSSWTIAYHMTIDFDVVLNPINNRKFASASFEDNIISLFELPETE